MSEENAGGAAVALEDADMPTARVQDNWGMRLWSWIFGGSHSENSEMMDARRNGCRMARLEFDLAIEDRKSEVKVKAEEERLEGLRRIATADMLMSSTGSSSVEPFPNEIWLQILKKMMPQDRYSMFQVHRVFRDMLESTYFQDILFPLVLDNELPLVHKYLLPVPSVDDVPNEFGMQDPPSLKHLKILRLVSKSLRDSVDELIESRLLNLMRDMKPRPLDELELLHFFRLCVGQSEEELEGILENSRGLKRFFIRALSVDFTDMYLTIQRHHGRRENTDIRPHFDILKDHIAELLEHVGTELLYFNLTIRIDACLALTSLDLYNIIRQMLMSMPNLKWLVLEVDDFYNFYDMDSALTSEYEPMPQLRRLERFDLKGWNEIWIGDAIVSANPHIKIYQRAGSANRFARHFNNPLWLAVPLESAYFDAVGAAEPKQMPLALLRQIPENNWRLKILSISFRTLPPRMTSTDGVFRFIQRIQTLEDVGLYIDHVKIGDESNFLRLPNLKDFTIEFGPRVEYSEEGAFFFSLQFLFHCKKLTTLVWRNLMEDAKPIRRMMNGFGSKQAIWIDFKGGNADLSKSNIWDVFPQLRIIKTSFRENCDFWSWGPSEVKWFSREYRSRELVKEHDAKPWYPWYLDSD